MFPSDIARWALGGRSPDTEENNTASGAEAPAAAAAPLSDEDMRARRMARLAALEKQSSSAGDDSMDVDKSDDKKMNDKKDDMEVDTPSPAKPNETAKTKTNSAESTTSTMSSEPAAKKQATKLSPAEKLLRKKNQILKKVLLLSLSEEGHGVNLNLEPNPSSPLKNDWDQSHIAEILATRLSYEKNDPRLDMARGGGGNDLIMYLNGCYRRSWGEWKELKERSGKKEIEGVEILEGILVEMRSQVGMLWILFVYVCFLWIWKVHMLCFIASFVCFCFCDSYPC